jgi:hypothetical protein
MYDAILSPYSAKGHPPRWQSFFERKSGKTWTFPVWVQNDLVNRGSRIGPIESLLLQQGPKQVSVKGEGQQMTVLPNTRGKKLDRECHRREREA